MTSKLSSEEKQTCAEDGLVKPDCRLPEQTMQRMRSLADSTLAATKGQPPESIVCPYLPGWNGLPEEITNEWLTIAGGPVIVDTWPRF